MMMSLRSSSLAKEYFRTQRETPLTPDKPERFAVDMSLSLSKGARLRLTISSDYLANESRDPRADLIVVTIPERATGVFR